MSENIKLAVLQKYLFDGELARHVNLQSSRLTTYDLARKEEINYFRAKQTWTAPGGSDPMDLWPLGKGNGGKNCKGKGDKSVKPKECFYHGKPGQQQERVQELLSCAEEQVCSTRQGWSVRRCGGGSRDRQEKTFWRKKGQAR